LFGIASVVLPPTHMQNPEQIQNVLTQLFSAVGIETKGINFTREMQQYVCY
jgi:hypothetical protein